MIPENLPNRSRMLAICGLGLALALIPAQGHQAVDLDAARVFQGCPAELLGAWRSSLDVRGLFRIGLTIVERTPKDFAAVIISQQGEEEVPVWHDGERLRFQSVALPIAFDGMLTPDGAWIEGFVQHGSTISHTRLGRADGSEEHTWSSDWSPLGVSLDTATHDLYIERDDDGVAGGYFFFRDQRLPALWGYGLECRDGLIRLGEKNLGLRLEGRFDPSEALLSLTARGAAGAVDLVFRRLPQDQVPQLPDAPDSPPRPDGSPAYMGQAPESLGDGWPTAEPAAVGLDVAPLGEMVRAIVDQEMTLTHSVLVARRGRLVVEEYFYGFDRDTWHDMRSASKTVTSALIGLAIDERRIESVQAPALGFFPRYRSYANWDSRKAQITVRDLLRMASGLDANDSDPRSAASEGAYQSQIAQPDWVKLALDAPMIADPGSNSLYGGANPLILGGILEAALEEPVEWFADRTLFGPLGIGEYKFILDPIGIVYMGGGLYMRPRDMAKFGQLYLDGGTWQGKRVLSEEWVRESTGKYGRLAPLDRNGHQYGYLWWHHVYRVGDRTIETIEARGAGGQYIFVVPSLELVAVITSGNYRNGRFRQPEEILERFVLPAAFRSARSP
ncbi:MAG: serine hydrolase [Gemmatimonadota bacterium]|nr:MAG: serine hydrolase [Gemmatimonadota bacterium]